MFQLDAANRSVIEGGTPWLLQSATTKPWTIRRDWVSLKMFEFFGRVMMCIWWLCRQCWDVEGATVSGSRQRTQQNKPAAYQDHPTWSNLIQLDPTWSNLSVRNCMLGWQTRPSVLHFGWSLASVLPRNCGRLWQMCRFCIKLQHRSDQIRWN